MQFISHREPQIFRLGKLWDEVDVFICFVTPSPSQFQWHFCQFKCVYFHICPAQKLIKFSFSVWVYIPMNQKLLYTIYLQTKAWIVMTTTTKTNMMGNTPEYKFSHLTCNMPQVVKCASINKFDCKISSHTDVFTPNEWEVRKVQTSFSLYTLVRWMCLCLLPRFAHFQFLLPCFI